MNPLYNFGIRTYALAARLASLRSPKVGKMIDGQRLAFDAVRRRRLEVAPDGFDVWFHASSLGEFEQARPIIERLRAASPDKKILLTFFSPSGYTVRSSYDRVDCVAYLPFDTPRRVARFLDAARPKVAIFAKYEFWGNYLEQLRRSGAKIYIISSIFRPAQRFFRPWGGMFRSMLRCYDHLYVQDERSRQLLAGIGVDNVTVAGDTRFDRVTDIMSSAREVDEIRAFAASSPLTLVVGSSWQRDEDIYIPWLLRHPEVKAVIAPHEFDPARLEALRARLGGSPSARLLSELKSDPSAVETTHYIIVDCFGLLSSIYRYADIAIVGGGFGAGIHNINEAAVYGIPVLFGPNHHKFNEAARLLELGGAFSFSDAASFEAVAGPLVTDASARTEGGRIAGQYIKDSIGASDIIYSDIFGDKASADENINP